MSRAGEEWEERQPSRALALGTAVAGVLVLRKPVRKMEGRSRTQGFEGQRRAVEVAWPSSFRGFWPHSFAGFSSGSVWPSSWRLTRSRRDFVVFRDPEVKVSSWVSLSLRLVALTSLKTALIGLAEVTRRTAFGGGDRGKEARQGFSLWASGSRFKLPEKFNDRIEQERPRISRLPTKPRSTRCWPPDC